REELYGFLHDDGWTITVPGLALDLFLDGAAIAAASGDVDGDGIDEVVALDDADRVWICELEPDGCDAFDINDALDQLDVTVADVDGDSIEEPILLLVDATSSYAFAFDAHNDEIGVVGSYFGRVDDEQVTRIAAGDADGDLVAELVALRDPCVFDVCNDQLLLIESTILDGKGEFQFASRLTMGNATVIDVAAADTDADDDVEVLALSSNDNTVLVHEVGPAAFIEVDAWANLPGTGAATRIAMADHDGDAPRATLLDGPQAVEGDLVPLAMILVPPYDRQYSAGDAGVSFGTSEGTSKSQSEGTSFGVNFSIGARGALVPGLVTIKAGAKFSQKVSSTKSFRERYNVGSRHSVKGNPTQLGPFHAGVILGWGCYDSYLYELDDPEGKLSDGKQRIDRNQMLLNVPTGGGEALYSSARYNAMVDRLGSLPRFEIPYEVGNPDTYPQAPEKLDGYPLGPDDVVFPEPGTYEVSDIGDSSFSLSYTKTETTSTSTSRSVGINGGVSVGNKILGVDVGAGADWGWTDGYSVGVSEGAFFRGGTPPIPDDPSTPEDEFAVNKFRYQPWVYLQAWTNPFDEPASIVVLTYSVQR
ncbi:MAG: VCBS repeat-containing protein, partial [Myxococcota bacterium]